MGIPIRQEGMISARRRQGMGSGEEGRAEQVLVCLSLLRLRYRGSLPLHKNEC